MQLINEPKEWVGKLVHVCGWNPKTVFRLKSTNGKNHVLITPKTHKEYETSNDLYMTRSHEQEYKELVLQQKTK